MESLLNSQKVKMLPVDKSEYQRIVVRRKHIWEDTLHRFKSGINFRKYIRVTFVGEPAVDDGGPFREFLRLLIGNIVMNNTLFDGDEDCRVPTSNMTELERHTYQHVGEMIAVSLIHGGPSPTFFAPSVVDYIVYGMKKVEPSVDEVPCKSIVRKLKEVCLYFYLRGILVILSVCLSLCQSGSVCTAVSGEEGSQDLIYGHKRCGGGGGVCKEVQTSVAFGVASVAFLVQ